MWSRSSKKEPSTQLLVGNSFQRLVQHFQAQQWTFDGDQQQRLLSVNVTGEFAQFHLVAVITEEDDTLEVLATLPVNAPLNKRHEVAEFCLRVCDGAKLGRFDFNFEDGTIRFHASAPYDDGDLPESVIQRCMGVTLLMADQCFPHLMSVIYGGVTAAHAVQTLLQQLR